MSKRLILPVGNIGSGKSTFIQPRIKNKVVVSLDGLRYMIGGRKYRFDPELEPYLYKTQAYLLHELMMDEKTIIIDETHMTRKSRERHIKTAKKHNYKVHVWLFPRLEKEEAVNRRMSNPHDCDNKKIWETVWQRKDNRYEEPIKKEGIDYIRKITRKEIGCAI